MMLAEPSPDRAFWPLWGGGTERHMRSRYSKSVVQLGIKCGNLRGMAS